MDVFGDIILSTTWGLEYGGLCGMHLEPLGNTVSLETFFISNVIEDWPPTR